MKTEIIKKIKMYKVFNDITLKNEILIFGSTFTAGFPFYELAKKYPLSNAIYNRSIEGLTILDANKAIDDCVLSAKPSKIFYALGQDDTNTSDSLSLYKELLNKTKKALPLSKIYIMSIPSTNESAKIFNDSLKHLCEDYGTEFIDIDYTKPYASIFKQLFPFFRSGKITFYEAFQMA